MQAERVFTYNAEMQLELPLGACPAILNDLSPMQFDSVNPDTVTAAVLVIIVLL